MSDHSPTDFRLLHLLRCIGASSIAHLADRTGLSVSEAESQLIDFGVARLVTKTSGPFGAWSITDRGRRVDEELITAEVAVGGCRPAVEAAFGRFLKLNPLVLDTCTAWQLRPLRGSTQINDHTDPGYDKRVLRQLVALERRGREVCNDLSVLLDRFADYGPRLSYAVNRALGGDGVFVTDDLNSFHSLWFQLHEDLLVTLGQPRHTPNN